MKVAIVGFGAQGQSALSYWRGDNEITICDRNSSLQLPAGVHGQLGENYLADLDRFDLIVRSPGIHPRDITKANSPAIIDKITSNTNEFLTVCPSSNVIGVTGTKGKGTTSTLIARMLEAAGKSVHLGGNIGTPPLDLLKAGIQPDDWVVLELANYQLIDLRYSPHIALCLMVAPEHLDWHAGMAEYVAAKQQLFKHQQDSDIVIYNAQNDWSAHIASASPGGKIPFMKHPGADVINGEITIENQRICNVSELKLLGKHNWQNACAATTAIWQIDQNVEAIRSVLTSFSGLEHRLELAGEVNEVKYYDDSFGTTPETAIVAIAAFDNPKIIILGGSDKGADYDELAQAVADGGVKKALLIGDQAARIQKAFEGIGFTDFEAGGKDMPAIVEQAASIAQPGDIVLLSPACASFDMFANYKQRGEQFKKAVQNLK